MRSDILVITVTIAAAAAATGAWLYARRALAAALDELARANVALHTDELTGLPNRRALHREVTARRVGNGPWSLMLLDLDHFKRVNDQHGHAAGDRLLIELADRLAANSIEHATVHRLHGDEFVVVMPIAAQAARPMAHRLIAALAAPIHLTGDARLAVTASAGLTDGWPGATVSELLRRADIALYQAKRTRATVRLFEHDNTQPTGDHGPPARRARRPAAPTTFPQNAERLVGRQAFRPHPIRIQANTGDRHV